MKNETTLNHETPPIVGEKCLCNFGEGDGKVLRKCLVTKLNDDNTYNVVALGMGWKMDNIPMSRWKCYEHSI